MRWERKTKTWVLILDENFVTRCFANLNPNIFSSKIMGNIFVLWKIVYLVVIESTSTFCYHFKLHYLCWPDEKENGHQLFDFPPIPPSRPGSSPSNGFEMKLWNDDLCGLINFVLIFTWKYWSTVFSHPTSSWLCATRWTFSLDNLTLYDLVFQHYYNYCVIGNIGYPSLHSGQEE